jgi:hypothetical protein
MVLAEGWEDIFQSLPGILTVTFIFGGWIIVAIVSSISKSWRKIHESEHAAALKQSMIERGMSVEDIERVMRAGPPADAQETAAASGGGTSKKLTGELTEIAGKLVEHGVAAPAMEQILEAVRMCDPASRGAIKDTVETMLDNGAGSDQLIAAVRAIHRPTATEPLKEARLIDDAGSFRR